MIVSCPIPGGFAYFETLHLAPRTVAPGSHTIPIEATAPLLPIGAKPIANGKAAIGVICYPQTAEQAAQSASLPRIKKIELETDDFSLASALVRGIITTVLLEVII